MKTKITLACFLAFIAALTAWKVSGCLHKRNETPQLVSQHSDTLKIVVHDTAWYPLAGKPRLLDSVFVAPPVKVDTTAILKRFFARYFYTDTLKDSNMVAIINDTLSCNKIINRKFHYRINRPEVLEKIVNTTVMQTHSVALYVGAFVLANRNVLGIGPEIILTTRTQAYGVGYDIQNKAISARIAWKLYK